MVFESHNITPKHFHLGNSQIYFRQDPNSPNWDAGQVESIVCEVTTRQYFFFVNPFKPLSLVHQELDPYGIQLPQAKIVSQKLGNTLIIEEGMIEGHIASFAYPASVSWIPEDAYCVVGIHFNVRIHNLLNKINH